jgi:hypothetical protein
MPHGIDSPLTLVSGAPAAKGTVKVNEPMSWIAVWIWQDPGLPNRGRAAATGRATYLPPETTHWSATTSLVSGSPPFTPGDTARAMALALVTAGGNQQFYWWQRHDVQIV